MKIADHFSALLYAFRTKPDFNIKSLLRSADCHWQIASTCPDKSYLFEHVYRFMATNCAASIDDLNLDECIILELKTAHTNLYLNDKLFRYPHSLALADQKRAGFSFEYDRSVLSPKIIYVPLSQIGLLSVGLRFDREIDANDLLSAIHNIRVIKDGTRPYIQTKINTHPAAQESNDKIREALNAISPADKNSTLPGYFQWKMPDYFSYLLGSLKDKVDYLSPPRLQVLSYIHPKEKSTDQNQTKSLLFRLARVYSENYHPSEQALKELDCFEQPFEEIHYAVFKEGAAILANEDSGGSNKFINEYGNRVVEKSLIWTWFLANIQHYSLINTVDRVSLRYSTDHSKVTNLPELVQSMYSIQIKCIFSQISHHSHHNKFYRMCCNALAVPALFEEMKEEISDLNNYIDTLERKTALELQEVEDKEKQIRDLRMNITLGAIGAGISAAQIAAAITPNLFIETLSGLAAQMGISLTLITGTYSPFIQQVIHFGIVLITNLSLGLIIAFLVRWILIKTIGKKKMESLNPVNDVQ